MIFIGDIALPDIGAVTIKNMPSKFLEKKWFGNLEGALINSIKEDAEKSIVYNDKHAINNMCSQFDFAGFALANNHIFDTGSFDATTSFLSDIEIPFCGIGASLEEANKPLVLFENGKQIVILNFGWEVIQCEVTTGNYFGVNPLRKEHVMNSVKETLEKFPNAAIVPFMHWSYELEAEPQPFERELAKHFIDMGVAGVIGTHPHRIGGFEMYNGKPIIYSLGNWMFKQNHYHNGKLRFPDFCNQELAFEWDFEANKLSFHFFEYNRDDSTLTYSHTEDETSETMKNYTPFLDLSDNDYKRWYKHNHYHKLKGLPIYYWDDSGTKTLIKNKVNKLRDSFIYLISKFR